MNQLALMVAGAFMTGLLIGGGAAWKFENSRKDLAVLQEKQKQQGVIDEAQKNKEKAEAEAIRVEHEGAQRLASVAQEYQSKLKEKNDQLAQALNNQRVPAKRLFINAPASACRSSALPGTSASASSGNGSARIELPRNVAERLIRRANTADEIVEQLGACQRVVIEDRELINGGHQTRATN